MHCLFCPEHVFTQYSYTYNVYTICRWQRRRQSNSMPILSLIDPNAIASISNTHTHTLWLFDVRINIYLLIVFCIELPQMISKEKSHWNSSAAIAVCDDTWIINLSTRFLSQINNLRKGNKFYENNMFIYVVFGVVKVDVR